MGSGLGQVSDITPCLWFRGFQICYWVRFFPWMRFISFAVVIIFHGVIVCWCVFKEFSIYVIREIQYFIGSDWGECLSTSNVDGNKWGVTECDSFHHFTIAPFNYSNYTCYQVVWLRAMLIVLNEFGRSTYVITEKRWIGDSNDQKKNTLINSIYLCCIYTWKTAVYIYPRFLSLFLCAPVLVDLCIRRIETVLQNIFLV